ncbi:hypothetical protein H5410_052685 [Solanum commersonii]|uniref:Chitin-binding type-1 domain-containing protein n=1 Tax=Solanum commersonii TaxID=4109 RepID=A0A9J5X271_SOLCO|nr:hypothetical protein H5410_052685 [Solanum commersonii]
MRLSEFTASSLLFLLLLLTVSAEQCGRQAGGGGARCAAGLCCSNFGWCGYTDAHCVPSNCQSQCPSPKPPTPGPVLLLETQVPSSHIPCLIRCLSIAMKILVKKRIISIVTMHSSMLPGLFMALALLVIPPPEKGKLLLSLPKPPMKLLVHRFEVNGFNI